MNRQAATRTSTRGSTVHGVPPAPSFAKNSRRQNK